MPDDTPSLNDAIDEALNDPNNLPADEPAERIADPLESYPKTWRAEAREHWATTPQAVRDEIARREENFHTGLAPYRQLAERLRPALEPFGDIIRNGQDPFGAIRNLGQYHQALSNGETAAEAAKALLADYGIDIGKLSGNDTYVHPQIKELQEQLRGVTSALSEQAQQAAQARQSAIVSQINSFAADPKNEHFNEVGDQMAMLIRADPRLTLEEAYAQACWLVEPVRKAMMSKNTAAATAAAGTAAAKSRAGVRSTHGSAPATGAPGTVDEIMRQTLAGIKARS